MSDNLPEKQLRFRNAIPDQWRSSLDTRLYWLWHQRLGTVQTIRDKTRDALDRTAAEIVMTAVYSDDLNPLILLLQRLEGGPMRDRDLRAEDTLRV